VADTPTIRFGTDGWRAVIGDGFTMRTVRICAAAIADWVKETPEAAERGVVVGHDRRFMSEQFALAVTETLLGQGVRVVWCEHGPVPTPAVTFTVPHTRAAAGVMVTASHNPPEYNGIKVKTANGAPAGRGPTDAIEYYAAKRLVAGDDPPRTTLSETFIDGRHMPIDPMPAYLDALRGLVEIERIQRANLRIVVDAMHGVGAGVLPRLLGTLAGMRPVIEIRTERNPLFPGIPDRKGPEPTDANLGPLKAAVRAHGADVGIAFDGDGDRIALVDGRGEYVSSQETFAMLAMYLAERDDVRDGAIVRSVNGTVRLDMLAERYGVPLIETPIGYAHIAPAMIGNEAMIGGEESGGFAFGTHLPERDAPLAALYILDLLARRGTDVNGLRYAVNIRTGDWFYRRVDVPLAPDAMDELRARLPLTDTATFDLAGSPVTKVVTLDGLKLIGEDRRWLLVRTSGTEPLARIYAEAQTTETLDALIAQGCALLAGSPAVFAPVAPVAPVAVGAVDAVEATDATIADTTETSKSPSSRPAARRSRGYSRR